MFKVKKSLFTPMLMQAVNPLKGAKFPGWSLANITNLLKQIHDASFAFQKAGHKLASKYLKEGETKGENGETMFTPIVKDGKPVENLFEGKEEGHGELFKEKYEALLAEEVEFSCEKLHENMLQKVELTVAEYVTLDPFIAKK